MEEKDVLASLEKLYPEPQLSTIRNTVAKNATVHELVMFLNLAKRWGLDPFAKEIWFIKNGNDTHIVTGRDGYLSIAERNPHYRGLVSDYVCENDQFTKDGGIIKHTYSLKNRGRIIGAYSIVYRDDRQEPIFSYVPFEEYKKTGKAWQQYPSAMIRKVAEVMSLKRAFSISGLTTLEEMGEAFVNPVLVNATKELPVVADRNHLQQALFDICGEKKDLAEEFLNVILDPDTPTWPQDAMKYLADLLVCLKAFKYGNGVMADRGYAREIWRDYLAYTKNNIQNAIELIKEILGDKPSHSWTKQDLVWAKIYVEELRLKDKTTLEEDIQQ